MNDKTTGWMRLCAGAALAISLLVGVDAQSGRKDNWVSAWSAAPVARAIGPAATAPAPAGTTSATARAAATSSGGPALAAPAGGPGGRGNGPGAGGAAPGAAPAGGRGGAALLVPNNQTIRQIVHLSLGGDRLRVVFANSL